MLTVADSIGIRLVAADCLLLGKVEISSFFLADSIFIAFLFNSLQALAMNCINTT